MTNKLEKTILALALVGSMATASYVVYDTINPNRQYILNTLTSLYRRVFEPPPHSTLTRPEATIIICHVPPRFDNITNGIDMAEFWQQRMYMRHDSAILSPSGKPNRTVSFTEEAVIPGTVPEYVLRMQSGAPVFNDTHLEASIELEILRLMQEHQLPQLPAFVRKRANRGNHDLTTLYKELGIKKGISGHFHESAHRACDWQGRTVQEGTFANELFWNASYCDGSKAGLLVVENGKVAYHNSTI